MARQERAGSKRGAWAGVLLIILAFVLAAFGLVLHNIPLFAACAVALLGGAFFSFTSRIMDITE